MGSLDGRVALVSGAARGQGEAIARKFAAEGARVVLGDVLDEPGRRVAAEIGAGATYLHLDVTQPEDWQAAVRAATESYGKLNVLVNNAGILRFAALERMPLEEYLGVIRVNQVGCFLGMQAVVPAMRAAGGGSIINTSSVQGLEGRSGLTAYVASKFAVRGMTKNAALELGHYGIRVNSVHPGGIDTEMTRLPGMDLSNRDAPFANLPIPRIGQPEDVAALMVFLASDASAYCTGSEFVIDGGMMAGVRDPRFES
jgi:3alpha(or 20beta)-hydroxysteroid dehydrogenase